MQTNIKSIIGLIVITIILIPILSCKSVVDELQNETRWDKAALFELNKLNWEEGQGSFEGGKIAVVAKDEKTGAMAFYLQMPPKGLEDAHGGRLHSHTGTSHTLVIKGSVSAIVGGKEMTMKEGEYFRLPAGFLHKGSIIPGPDPTIMFMVTDGSFDLEYAKEGEEEMPLTSDLNQKDIAQPALFTMDNLEWQKGEGSFEGGMYATVCNDPENGINIMFLDMPPKEYSESHEGRSHSHSGLSHSILLKGTIKAKIGGEELTMNPGDYFRAPAGFEHVGSHVPGPDHAIVMMITEGGFDVN